MLVWCGFANEKIKPTNGSENKQTNIGALTYFSIVCRALQILFLKIAPQSVLRLRIFCKRKSFAFTISSIFEMLHIQLHLSLWITMHWPKWLHYLATSLMPCLTRFNLKRPHRRVVHANSVTGQQWLQGRWARPRRRMRWHECFTTSSQSEHHATNLARINK